MKSLRLSGSPRRHVLGGDDRALHDEHLDARGEQVGRELAGPLRAHPRGHGDPGLAHPLQRLGEQRGVDRDGVQLLQERYGRPTGRPRRPRDHPGERSVGVGVPRPQPLGVEHGQAAELPDPDSARG